MKVLFGFDTWKIYQNLHVAVTVEISELPEMSFLMFVRYISKSVGYKSISWNNFSNRF